MYLYTYHRIENSIAKYMRSDFATSILKTSLTKLEKKID